MEFSINTHGILPNGKWNSNEIIYRIQVMYAWNSTTEEVEF